MLCGLQSCRRQAEYALHEQRTANELAGVRTEGERLACSQAQAEAICQASDAQLKDLQQQHRKVIPKSCNFRFLCSMCNSSTPMRLAAQHAGLVHLLWPCHLCWLVSLDQQATQDVRRRETLYHTSASFFWLPVIALSNDSKHLS